MESSTKALSRETPCPSRILEATEWASVAAWLASRVSLDEMARKSGALVRKRVVQNASELLRLVLAYALGDLSLCLVGAWWPLVGSGRLSKTAVRQRLRHCVLWLGQLIVALLPQPSPSVAGRRLRIQDATVVNAPGSRGTDWRVHLCFDLGQNCLTDLELTDAHSGESLARFPWQAGEIVLADRGYACAQGLASVMLVGAYLVVRTGWRSLHWCDGQGNPFDISTWLRQLATQVAATAQSREVSVCTSSGRQSLRLIALRLAEDKAAVIRYRLRKHALKHGQAVDDNTLLAAGFVLVLTNLPAEQWQNDQVLALYRWRWQVEMAIKRLKGVGHLDALRAHDPELARAYLLGKLFAALLLDMMTHGVRAQHPDWFTSQTRPVSLWRLHALFWAQLWQLVYGPVRDLWAILPHLQASLCNEPRRRLAQDALARAFSQSIGC